MSQISKELSGAPAISRKQMPKGRPWVKGQSGNLSGRPPKSLMQQKYEALANDPEFVEKWWKSEQHRLTSPGMAGVLSTDKMMDRVEGKVAQVVDMKADVTFTLSDTLAKRRKRASES